MTKILGLAVAVLAYAISAHAVEIEGPAQSPSNAPTAPAPIVVPAIPEGLGNGSLPLTSAILNLDVSALPTKSASLSPSAQAAANAPTASAAPVPAAKTIPQPVGTVDNPFRPAARPARPASPQATAAASITNISEHVAKAAEAANKAGATSETGADAGREIQRELTGEKDAPGDYVSTYLQGVKDGTIPTGPRLSPASKPGEYRARTGYNALYGIREEFVNPGHVYSQAYYAASWAAQKRGLSGRVHFAEVTGSLPLRDGDHAKFAFVPAGPTEKPTIIYVDFSRSLVTAHGDFDVRTAVYYSDAGSVYSKLWPEFDEPKGYDYMGRAFERGPQTAFEEARRAVPGFAAKGGVSFSARIEKDETTGDVDAWYRLYDEAGAVVSVNARTLEARILTAPAPAKPPVDWRAVAKHSGPFALLGLAAIALWFSLAFALTRDVAWSVSLVKWVLGIVSFVVGADVYGAAQRYRKK